MNESTKTKKALRGSLFALFACIVLLIGTTFAWFTDTASTGVNRIQAGNLKVGLQYKNADMTEYVNADGAEDIFKQGTLWEPGHLEYVNLKVSNLGNLALTYKLGINIADEKEGVNVAGEKFKLSENLEYAVVDGLKTYTKDSDGRAQAVADAKTGSKALTEAYNATGNLYPDAKKDTDHPAAKDVTLIVYMPETVGNEANAVDSENAASIDLGINLAATQVPYESDSFGTDYDANAEYPTAVSTASELTAAVKNGGYVVLENDIKLKTKDIATIPENKDVTIDLNGKTVNATGNFATINTGAKLTISGGTVNSGRYVFDSKGGEVVVNGGNFTAQESVCALFGGSKLTVNGGTFTSKDNSVISTNGSEANGCEITVNGGTFNANIQSAGYIACGVYVANKDTVKLNGGTFNITDGVGVLMRAGNTTIGKNVVINMKNTGKVTAGKIGDANIDITTPSQLVVDVRSQYPGLDSSFNVVNNSNYSIVEYK